MNINAIYGHKTIISLSYAPKHRCTTIQYISKIPFQYYYVPITLVSKCCFMKSLINSTTFKQ